MYFIAKDGRYINSRDSAEYIRVVSEPDSGSTLYNVQEFYKSGSIHYTGKSSKIAFTNFEGPFLEYYASGKKKFFGTYANNKFYGKAYRYYPNGVIYAELDYGDAKPGKPTDDKQFDDTHRVLTVKDSLGNVTVLNGNGYCVNFENDNFKIPFEQGRFKDGLRDSIWTGEDLHMKIKFTEKYAAGKLLSAIAIDSAGAAHTYAGSRSVRPQYKGGLDALYYYIGHAVVYPDYARRYDIEGEVILTFTVQKDGRVADVKVLKSVDPSLDNEAIRVISASRKWIPGTVYGIPTGMHFSIPVNFKLTD